MCRSIQSIKKHYIYGTEYNTLELLESDMFIKIFCRKIVVSKQKCPQFYGKFASSTFL